MNHRLTFVFLGLIAGLAAWTANAQGPAVLDPAKLRLASANALVVDTTDNHAVYAKAANEVTPIASLTKLMTAIVTLDARLPLDEPLAIDMDDLDFLKGTHSRLRMGSELPRREMLRLALMSSENRAASSLARTYPGGTPAFVAAMNAKARALGMSRTHYADATGLSPENVSTASDLAIVVGAAAQYPLIREFSTTGSHYVELQPTRPMARLQQHEQSRQERAVGYPALEDRLHSRGWKVPRDDGHDRQPPVRHRAARFGGSLHAPGRCRPRSPLARDR